MKTMPKPMGYQVLELKMQSQLPDRLQALVDVRMRTLTMPLESPEAKAESRALIRSYYRRYKALTVNEQDTIVAEIARRRSGITR